MSDTIIVWFRRDLRLRDNPALYHAAKRGTVLPVFIWAPDEESPWQPGKRSRQRLQSSLKTMYLCYFKGPTKEVLAKLVKQTGAKAVFWNNLPEPHLQKRDDAVQQFLSAKGVEVHRYDSCTLFRPEDVLNGSGGPYQVFTAFWNKCKTKPISEPLPKVNFERASVPGLSLEELGVSDLPILPAGETETIYAFKQFLPSNLSTYEKNRDFPSLDGTSNLSAALHFGEVTPRQIFAAVNKCPPSPSRETYLKELGWREFSHYLLRYFPHTPDAPLRPEFTKFPWRNDPDFLKAWQTGQTGYPIVDAAMRELAATGRMHNRLRMIVASFLVKDLLIDWREGAKWFWDNLLDADLAQNTLGWQWTAGCGADAAPFFRIFNPTTQGQKFDPQGTYIRQHLPELNHLPDKHIHEPYKAPAHLRPTNYPPPIVPHSIAREVALEKFKQLH